MTAILILDFIQLIYHLLFSEPQFLESELIRIKKYLKNVLLLAEEDAKLFASQMFIKKVFAHDDRRMMYTPQAILKELESVTIKEIRSLHESLWNYSWIYTVGGSRASINNTTQAIKKIYSIYAQKNIENYVVRPNATTTNFLTTLHNVPNKQNIEFSIGASLPLTRASAEYPAFVFGMSVLGIQGGFAGRLMSTVREKEGLTYGIYAKPEDVSLEENGVWRIGTFFSPKDAMQGLSSTFREISSIQKKGITVDELKRFKAILNTRYALIEDSLLKRVGETHALQKLSVDTAMYTSYKNTIQNLTQKEVNNALAKYLNPNNCIVSGAGPIKSVEKEIIAFKG
jgi:zinc protease